jgi:prophage regulatory protein
MQYYSDRQTAARYGVSRATWWRWVREGHAPAPVKLSPGCTRWRLPVLEAWESEREAAQ